MSGSYSIPGQIVNSLSHTGSTVGFFGATPAAQNPALPDATNPVDVTGLDPVDIMMLNIVLSDHATRLNLIVDALQAHGLMAT